MADQLTSSTAEALPAIRSSALLAAVDALRGALGDNPCVILDGKTGKRHYFSDPELEIAIRKMLPHLPANTPAHRPEPKP